MNTHDNSAPGTPAAERTTVALNVNGAARSVDVEPRTTLADALRESLGLKGTHLGCAQGSCGTCTVLLDGRSVRSCLLLAVQAADRTVETVESLADGGELNTLQESLSACHGLQCGFCTPGMLMRATELLRADPSPDRDQVRAAVSSNLCRCTGYTFIVDGILASAGALARDALENGQPFAAAATSTTTEEP